MEIRSTGQLFLGLLLLIGNLERLVEGGGRLWGKEETRPPSYTPHDYPRYPSSCNLETLTMERFFNGD